MSDYSLPRIKESELPEATSIDKVRVLDNAGKSVWVERRPTDHRSTGNGAYRCFGSQGRCEYTDCGWGWSYGRWRPFREQNDRRCFSDDGITVNADNIKLNIVNDLVTTSATRPLSATQGKKLQDEITQLAGK